MYIRRLQAGVVALLFSFAASEPACFFPDGKNATNLSPCNPDADVSHCCRDSDVCLSNGLCFSSGLNSIVRRGCTDETWKSPNCPNVCNTEIFRSTDAVLTPCGGYNNFCCGQDEAARNCCNNGNTTLAAQVAGSDIIPFGPCTSGTSGSPTTGSTTSSSSTNGPTQPAAGDSCPSSLKTERTALIGVAAAFGAVMVGAAALAMFWRREMKKQEKEKLKKESERSSLEKDKQMLEQDKQWLERAIPASVLREMENTRRNTRPGA